jgi:hypothetical protein
MNLMFSSLLSLLYSSFSNSTIFHHYFENIFLAEPLALFELCILSDNCELQKTIHTPALLKTTASIYASLFSINLINIQTKIKTIHYFT